MRGPSGCSRRSPMSTRSTSSSAAPATRCGAAARRRRRPCSSRSWPATRPRSRPIWRPPGGSAIRRARQWLEGDERLVSVYDLELPAGLAERARALHTAVAEPLHQSVRGGTQTEGHLLARIEPEIQEARRLLAAAVGAPHRPAAGDRSRPSDARQAPRPAGALLRLLVGAADGRRPPCRPFPSGGLAELGLLPRRAGGGAGAGGLAQARRAARASSASICRRSG